MGSVGVIRKRLLVAAALGLILMSGTMYATDAGNMADTLGVDEDDVDDLTTTWWGILSLIFSYVSWTGLSYGIVSFVNVAVGLLSRGGVNDQIVAVIGGVMFWIGVDLFNLFVFIPLAIEEVTLVRAPIVPLGVSMVLTVIGLTLMVKG